MQRERQRKTWSRSDNRGWEIESCAVSQTFLMRGEIVCVPEDSNYGPLDFTAKSIPELSKHFPI